MHHPREASQVAAQKVRGGLGVWSPGTEERGHGQQGPKASPGAWPRNPSAQGTLLLSRQKRGAPYPKVS